eukprot:TRINITY_DN53107_c0_g1_i1.p1 TRINITY_DN53107_c0_g1~~TRINITY_DN53107_c0_g1_i1.p1  ORF type:complete len:795 (-),score=170.03 TRINITY_DN53107_c0_g1_i1:94-2220(-)
MAHDLKMDATRDLYSTTPVVAGMTGITPFGTEEDLAVLKGTIAAEESKRNEMDEKEQLVEVVRETMITLGLTVHTERLLQLLLDNGVTSLATLERLNQERAMELQMPWSLIDATQRRWRAEKMSKDKTVEDDPFKKMLEANKANQRDKANTKELQNIANLPGQTDADQAKNSVLPLDDLNLEDRLQGFEQQMARLLDDISYVQETVMDAVQNAQNALFSQMAMNLDTISQRIDFAQVPLVQTVNSNQVLLHKLDSSQEAVLKRSEDQGEQMKNVASSFSELFQAVSGLVDESPKAAELRILESVTGESLKINEKLDTLQTDLQKHAEHSKDTLKQIDWRAHNSVEAAQRHMTEIETHVNQRIEELGLNIASHRSADTQKLSEYIASEVRSLSEQSTVTSETMERSVAVQEERMADVRRHNMMILDLLASTQASAHDTQETMKIFTREEMIRQEIRTRSYDEIQAEIRHACKEQIDRLRLAILGPSAQVNGDEPASTCVPSTDTSESGGPDVGTDGQVNSEAIAPGSSIKEILERIEASTKVSAEKPVERVDELVRQEMTAVAMALYSQQREVSENQIVQVAQVVHDEISRVEEKFAECSGKVDEVKTLVQNPPQALQTPTPEDNDIEKSLKTGDTTPQGDESGRREYRKGTKTDASGENTPDENPRRIRGSKVAADGERERERGDRGDRSERGQRRRSEGRAAAEERG